MKPREFMINDLSLFGDSFGFKMYSENTMRSRRFNIHIG